MIEESRVPLTLEQVQALLDSQFPEWAKLPIQALAKPGWDHWTYRLGATMLMRLPSAPRYRFQVEKESRWLPFLAPKLSIEIPRFLALGQATDHFLWPWSIMNWIPGESADIAEIRSMPEFAEAVAAFLRELHGCDASSGPRPGVENFFRGGSLSAYSQETEELANALQGSVDSNRVLELWKRAVESHWNHKAVWVHGDLSPGNLLVKEGGLKAVIDFGLMALGDPACDLALAWSFFSGESRRRFRESLDLDRETWWRGQGWCLWKALFLLKQSLNRGDESEGILALIEDILEED